MKEKLIALSACKDALIWAGDKSLYEIWVTCERGDWMLWLLRKLKCDLRLLTACKAACAEFARPYMNDARSIAALDAAHAFGRGELSEKGLKSFAAASASAEDDAAAYAAAYAAARAEILKKCADEVRRLVSVEKITELNNSNG